MGEAISTRATVYTVALYHYPFSTETYAFPKHIDLKPCFCVLYSTFFIFCYKMMHDILLSYIKIPPNHFIDWRHYYGIKSVIPFAILAAFFINEFSSRYSRPFKVILTSITFIPFIPKLLTY